MFISASPSQPIDFSLASLKFRYFVGGVQRERDLKTMVKSTEDSEINIVFK